MWNKNKHQRRNNQRPKKATPRTNTPNNTMEKQKTKYATIRNNDDGYAKYAENNMSHNP